MDVRFCEQQESSPRGTHCELGNFAIMRLARSPRRARRIVFSLDIDLSWMSATRRKRERGLAPMRISPDMVWLGN